MWDDGIRMAGTHDKKLTQLIDSKAVEEVPYNL